MIRLAGLSKRYGRQLALRPLDLEIPAGQLVGFLGPNGAGKSTTLRLLTGMLLPDSGTAEVFGHDVVSDPVAVKRVVGYVPESGAVFETLTGWEYLSMVASLHGIEDDEAASRIMELTQFFELSYDTLTDKQLGAYSKGMRQKIVITAALLHRPRAIFFDEPLNGLDANAALSFKTLALTLAKTGRTILYCSHVLDVVERTCDRVVILHQGRLIADGTVASILERSGQPSLEQAFNALTGTRDLLGSAEEMARELAR